MKEDELCIVKDYEFSTDDDNFFLSIVSYSELTEGDSFIFFDELQDAESAVMINRKTQDGFEPSQLVQEKNPEDFDSLILSLL